MKKLIPLAVVILCLIGLGVWYYSDKKIVERKSLAFVQCFEKEEGDGLLTGAFNENDFLALLDKKVAIDFEQRDMPDMPAGIKYDRAKLAKSYLYVINSAKMIQITAPSIAILEIDEHSAKVSIDLHGEVKHASYSINSDLSILLNFKNTDEGWRVGRVIVKKKD